MKLLWLDLETTGLDPAEDFVLEVAHCLADLERPFDVTPVVCRQVMFNLKVKAAFDLPGKAYTCFDDNDAFLRVHPNVFEMHEKSGLWGACREATWTLRAIEENIFEMYPCLQEPAAAYDDRPILAGSSAHFDLSFIRVHMPKLAEVLAHRVYDVSAVKLFARSLGMPRQPKAEAHRADKDVIESIAHARLCEKWFLAKAEREESHVSGSV